MKSSILQIVFFTGMLFVIVTGLISIQKTSAESFTDWIVSANDHICGISEPQYIVSPLQVNYKKVLFAAPSMKKIVKNKVKKNSARWQVLMSQAKREVQDACTKIMNERNGDSVWKKIKYKKGTHTVTDITSLVIQEL